MKKIVLIGFAACYKSSVGKLLADKLGLPLIDTDSEIERANNMTVEQIINRYGEKHFRKLESDILATIVSTTNVVVSCGGGSVLADGFQEFVANSTVVWLTASASTVSSRLSNTPRPLFDNLSVQELDEFIRRRHPIYERYSDAQFATDGKTPEQLAEEVFNYVTNK